MKIVTDVQVSKSLHRLAVGFLFSLCVDYACDYQYLGKCRYIPRRSTQSSCTNISNSWIWYD